MFAIGSYGSLKTCKQVVVMAILASEKDPIEEQMCCMISSIAQVEELNIVIWPCLTTGDLDCHTDVLTISMGIRAPALLIRSPGVNGVAEPFIKGKEILRFTAKELLEKLRKTSHHIQANPALMPAEHEKMKMEECEELGRKNAEWVRKEYDLVLFDTEGVIKRLNQVLNERNFIKQCRPFFGALTVDENGDSREDSPQLAVVSNFGQTCTDKTGTSYHGKKRVNGDWVYGFDEDGDKPWKPQCIKDEVIAMFEEEGEWVNEEAHAAPRVYISYYCEHPEGRYEKKMASADGEWSAAWSMPDTGMLSRAMTDAKVKDPSRVLMLSHHSHTREAAKTMGIDYIYHEEPGYKDPQNPGQGLWFAPGQELINVVTEAGPVAFLQNR